MIKSVGELVYCEPYKAIVVVDKEIVNYYLALLPKYISVNRQKYPPHISVVRYEVPPNSNLWYKYQGEQIEFTYEPILNFGKVYCWLKVQSTRLEDIREELGLPRHNEVTRPPNGEKCFHITCGNFKGL